MRRLVSFIALTIILLGFGSCSSTPPNASLIPSDVPFVASLDLHSIYKKGKFDQIDDFQFVKALREELKSEDKELSNLLEQTLKDPKSTGIDFKEEILFFIDMEGNDPRFTFAISDQEKFETFLKKIFQANQETFAPTQRGKLKGVDLGDGGLVWDDEKAITGSGSMEVLYLFFSLKKENQIVGNKSFKKFCKDKKDINFWVSFDGFLKLQGGADELSGMFMKDFADSYVSAFLDFQDGQVHLETKTDLSKEWQKKLDKHKIFKDNFNAELLKFVPQNPLVAMSICINPTGYFNYLQEVPQFAMVNGMVQMYSGLDLKKIFESFKGSFLFSLNDVKMVERTYPYAPVFETDEEGNPIFEEEIPAEEYTELEPAPKFSVLFDVNGTSVLDALLIKALGELNKEDDVYKFPSNSEDNQFYGVYANNVFMLSNDIESINAFKKGGLGRENLSKHADADNFSDNPSYGFLNMGWDALPQGLKDWYSSEKLGYEAQQALKFYQQTFKKLEFKGTKKNTSEITLKLKNTKENSLYFLLKTADQTFQTF